MGYHRSDRRYARTASISWIESSLRRIMRLRACAEMCRVAPDVLQVRLTQPATSIAPDVKEVVPGKRGADCRGRLARATAEHDGVPGVAFELVGLAVFLVCFTGGVSGLLHVFIVSVHARDAFPSPEPCGRRLAMEFESHGV